MIEFWILLILFVFHFALAAPVPEREILEVRPNAVGVLKDGKAAWEKRMDLDDGDHWSTDEAYRKDDNPGRDPDPDDASGGDAPSGDLDDAPGSDYDDFEGMLGSESPWDEEQMGSDGRGPDPYYNNPPEIDEDNNNPTEIVDDNNDPPEIVDNNNNPPEYDGDRSANEAYLKDHDPGSASDDLDDAPSGDLDDAPGDDYDEFEGMLGSESPWNSEQLGSDGRGPDPYYNNPPEDDKSGDNAVKSEQASAETTPPTGVAPESEHPATPEHMTDLEKLLKGSIRPRNSGSGAVGTPKREW
jgi:hypothetical protein